MPNSISLPVDLQNVKERLQSALVAQGVADFNLDQWLQEWLQRPQPALGGARPAELLNSQDGIQSVCRALGGAISGAYQ
jgi:uncharacterized protein (DUF2384 family)